MNKRKMSKAQEVSLNLFVGAMTLALVACLIAPLFISFGGAYNGAAEFMMLLAKLCWLVVSRTLIVASIPFVLATFIKGLF